LFAKWTVEIETQATHPLRGHARQCPRRCCFRIDDRNAPASSRQGVEALQQHAVVGAVKARLHNDKPPDGARRRHPLELLQGGDIWEIGSVGDLWVVIRWANNMDVTVATHSGCHARNRAATASPVSRVPSFPPTSAVDSFAAIAASTAFSIAAAAASNELALLRRPCQASSIAADTMRESGLATFLPAISGADPCAACAMPWFVPALREAAIPRLPDNSAVRSDRISPYILDVTITSKSW